MLSGENSMKIVLNYPGPKMQLTLWQGEYTATFFNQFFSSQELVRKHCFSVSVVAL